MLDLGIHIADLIRWLKGTPVVAVSGILNTWEKPTHMEDNGMALLRFADGTLGYFQASWVYRPTSEGSIVVQGEKGTLFVGTDLHRPLFARLRSSSNDEGELVSIDVPAEDRNRNQYDRFARSILSGDGEAFVSGEEASKSLEVILAAYQSARTGRQVTLEPGSQPEQ